MTLTTYNFAFTGSPVNWTVPRHWTSIDAALDTTTPTPDADSIAASQADWTPDKVPALWAPVRKVAGAQPDEWVQPAGASDAYSKGDRVTFQGQVWESVIDANVWSPTAYPAGWKKV